MVKWLNVKLTLTHFYTWKGESVLKLLQSPGKSFPSSTVIACKGTLSPTLWVPSGWLPTCRKYLLLVPGDFLPCMCHPYSGSSANNLSTLRTAKTGLTNLEIFYFFKIIFFEREMLFISQTTTSLQIFCELSLYSQVIFKSIRVADDTFERNSWVWMG